MRVFRFVKKEAVFCVSFFLAVLSCLVLRPSLKELAGFCDWRVLSLLFSLMVIIQAFRSVKVLDGIAAWLLKKCPSTRKMYLAFVFLVFFSSMAVTNDVALLTFVPVSILACTRAGVPCGMLVILQTLAANLGSCFTPMGNPQNLYIYSFYNLPAADFFKAAAVIAVPSVILLAAAVLFLTFGSRNKHLLPLDYSSVQRKSDSGADTASDEAVEPDKYTVPSYVRIFVYFAVFVLIMLSVFRAVDYRISLVTVFMSAVVLDRNLLKKVDYCLILTFVSFFIFTKNIAGIPEISAALKNMLKSSLSVYIAGIAVSQIISNVPSALLLSGFTDAGIPLMLGVNVGGLGTLVASLASVISYKLYSTQSADTGKKLYLIIFTAVNIIFMLVLVPLCMRFVL